MRLDESIAPAGKSALIRIKLAAVYLVTGQGFTSPGIFRVAASIIIIVVTPLSVLHVVLAPTLARLHFERRTADLQRLLDSLTPRQLRELGPGNVPANPDELQRELESFGAPPVDERTTGQLLDYLLAP